MAPIAKLVCAIQLRQITSAIRPEAWTRIYCSIVSIDTLALVGWFKTEVRTANALDKSTNQERNEMKSEDGIAVKERTLVPEGDAKFGSIGVEDWATHANVN